MEDSPKRWRRRPVDNVDCHQLSSALLCLSRILIVLQHLVLLATPADRHTGTYTGTEFVVFIAQFT